MRNQQNQPVNEISICELAKLVNADLQECQSDPGWRFSTNSSTGIDYGSRATVVSPKDIPFTVGEVSVPESIREIVLRRYQLAFGKPKSVATGALEAVAA